MLFGIVFLLQLLWHPFIWLLIIVVPTVIIGLIDIFQNTYSIRKNFPLIGRMRWLMESIRPFIRQYLLDTYQLGYEWISHSMAAHHFKEEHVVPRILIGGPDCQKPYSASMLNISAMIFGSLSNRAIIALNGGAKKGGFYHNTGEGGVSPHHLENGGNLVWQIGTGYFGCLTSLGEFCSTTFKAMTENDNIKMIEIKMSQGAKPGHGGILPAVKNTPEITALFQEENPQDLNYV
jgi:glutamate synthase domain-containing protein 2